MPFVQKQQPLVLQGFGCCPGWACRKAEGLAAAAQLPSMPDHPSVQSESSKESALLILLSSPPQAVNLLTAGRRKRRAQLCTRRMLRQHGTARPPAAPACRSSCSHTADGRHTSASPPSNPIPRPAPCGWLPWLERSIFWRARSPHLPAAGAGFCFSALFSLDKNVTAFPTFSTELPAFTAELCPFSPTRGPAETPLPSAQHLRHHLPPEAAAVAVGSQTQEQPKEERNESSLRHCRLRAKINLKGQKICSQCCPPSHHGEISSVPFTVLGSCCLPLCLGQSIRKMGFWGGKGFALPDALMGQQSKAWQTGTRFSQ